MQIVSDALCSAYISEDDYGSPCHHVLEAESKWVTKYLAKFHDPVSLMEYRPAVFERKL